MSVAREVIAEVRSLKAEVQAHERRCLECVGSWDELVWVPCPAAMALIREGVESIIAADADNSPTIEGV